MSFPPIDPRAKAVWASETNFVVELEDGRILTVPCKHFARLQNAGPLKLCNVRLTGNGQGIHWPDCDEDLSVASLLWPAQGRVQP